MAMEFCELATLPQAINMNLFPMGDCSTFALLNIAANPFRMISDSRSALRNTSYPNFQEHTNSRRRTSLSINSTRVWGASSFPTLGSPHDSPWMCSLKTRGFRGKHRCGVTLLSGELSVTKNNYKKVFSTRAD